MNTLVYPFKNPTSRDPAEPLWLMLRSDELNLLLERGVLEPSEDIERSYDPVASD